MTRGIWPAFLTLAFIGFGLLGIWDLTWLAFQTLDAIRTQTTRLLKPPAAPTWNPDEEQPAEPTSTGGSTWRRDVEQPAAAGRHIRDIPIKKDEGIMALGVNNAGDYAPLIMQDEGAVRAAGKNVQTGPEWVAIRVDKAGRVICSPESFQGMVERLLKPGERIVIERAP